MDASNAVDTELPVQKQLDAYNTRDIDAFMPWRSEDCQYYEFPNRRLARGTAEIRERHKPSHCGRQTRTMPKPSAP